MQRPAGPERPAARPRGPTGPRGPPTEDRITLVSCENGTLFFGMDRDQAQEHLPRGFIAADAAAPAAKLPLPLSAGAPRTVVGFDAAICDSSSLGDGTAGYAQAYVQIHTPDLGPEHPLQPADMEFFDVDLALPRGPYRDLFLARGVEVRAAEVASEFTRIVADVGAGQGRAADAEGALQGFSYRTAASLPPVSLGLLRIWFAGDWGVGFIEVSLDQFTILAGAMDSCEVRAGTFHEAVVGGTACEPGEAVAIAIDDFDEVQTLRVFPSVFPRGAGA